jgi:transcriptional regulator with XRE-family HTH domain
MANDSGQLQQIIAANIASLRRSNGLTQAGLAERLGYSDKSVSKWERAEGLPDILCLKAMADLFGVSVDYLLEADHPGGEAGSGEDIPGTEEDRPVYQVNRRNIALLSVAGVWLLAAVLFVSALIAGHTLYLPFVAAVPVSAILLTVFAALWGDRIQIFLSVTLLVWGLLFLICWTIREKEPWLLMTLGIPATAVTWLSCRVKTKKKPEEKKSQPFESR